MSSRNTIMRSGKKFDATKTANFCNRVSIWSSFCCHITGLVSFTSLNALSLLTTTSWSKNWLKGKLYLTLSIIFIRFWIMILTKLFFFLTFGFNWKNSWYFGIYQLLLLPEYFSKTFTLLAIYLFFLNSVKYCSTYFRLVKKKWKSSIRILKWWLTFRKSIGKNNSQPSSITTCRL